MKQRKLYEAAGEFEWARKLMPGHPDPRLNLGLTLEEAGQVDEAIQTYKTALEVYPGHIQTVEALARHPSIRPAPGDRTRPRRRRLDPRLRAVKQHLSARKVANLRFHMARRPEDLAD